MPIHDWTLVFPGTFHDFHCSWITHLKEGLNASVLPESYYATAEQHAGDIVPDVLTLSRAGRGETESVPGGLDVAVAPPEVSLHMVSDEETTYRELRRTLVIRHRTSREVVAMIEIVSPGNKSGAKFLEQFVEKSVAAIRRGIHVLVVDLHPPTPRDPRGVHGAIWDIIGGEFDQPSDRQLTAASYVANRFPEAFVEPLAVGMPLPAMPLFLDTGRYVSAPLEQTYTQAYQALPNAVTDVIEGREPPEWTLERSSE